MRARRRANYRDRFGYTRRATHGVVVSYGGHPDQRWGHISYAQHGDDLFLLNVFDLIGVHCGRYLDIGAHHPTTISNTRLLYERGWRGLNVEANPRLIKAFDRDRPEDLNLCVGVADKGGILPFYMLDPESGRNTFDLTEATAVSGQLQRSMKAEMNLKVITLDWIIRNYAGGTWPHLLSMDIEGLDYAALEASAFDKDNGPMVACVEVRRADSAKFVDLMDRKGYFLLARLAENMIFVSWDFASRVR